VLQFGKYLHSLKFHMRDFPGPKISLRNYKTGCGWASQQIAPRQCNSNMIVIFNLILISNFFLSSYVDLMQKCWMEIPEQRPTYREIHEYLKNVLTISPYRKWKWIKTYLTLFPKNNQRTNHYSLDEQKLDQRYTLHAGMLYFSILLDLHKLETRSY